LSPLNHRRHHHHSAEREHPRRGLVYLPECLDYTLP
jgi:hypothetical protein